MPESITEWSLTSLKEKLIQIGAKVVSHDRYIALQMAGVAPSHGDCSLHPAASQNSGRSRPQLPGETFTSRLSSRVAAKALNTPVWELSGESPIKGESVGVWGTRFLFVTLLKMERKQHLFASF
jgi:hypothetical protein